MIQKIYGSSDDNVCLQGDIHDEYGHFDSPGVFLQFNDGSTIKIAYSPDDSGCWRIEVINKGKAEHKWIQTGNDDDDAKSVDPDAMCYSDVLEMHWDEKFELLIQTEDEGALIDTSDESAILAAVRARELTAIFTEYNDDDEDANAFYCEAMKIIKGWV